ncbi:GAP family protein [Blastococcus sp. URHD0036]|uniref:GAP family protein n=1 Tax=Blastococcus sp. URHD0036 TaxID=1380356 RepID=UPI0004964A17|nr:GAP family protein [Blastococcus sp. URHD0036]
MGDVVGALLPLAAVVAVSPLPVLAAVLMLLAARAARTGPGFLAGWVVGIAGVTTAVLQLSGPRRDGGGPSAAAWAALVVGAALVLLGVRRWRSRPGPGEPAPVPRWAAAIDRFTAVRAGALGLALAALNPKALVVCVAAGVAIADGDLSGAQATWSVVVFTAVAASTVAVPVLASAVGGDRVAGPLRALRGWLTAHDAAVTAGLLVLVGGVLVAQGLRGLR